MKPIILAATITVFLISACDSQENKQSTISTVPQIQKPAISSIPAEVGSANSSLPVQVQVVGNYNIVKFKGKFYACPHGQEINWEKDDVTKFPSVFVADSQDAAIAMIKR